GSIPSAAINQNIRYVYDNTYRIFFSLYTKRMLPVLPICVVLLLTASYDDRLPQTDVESQINIVPRVSYLPPSTAQSPLKRHYLMEPIENSHQSLLIL